MKALVTGVTGNLGRRLVEELQRRDWSVDAFVLPDEAASFSNKEGMAVYQGDINNRDSVDQAMENSMPDVVFHLAAYVQLGIINNMKTKEEMYSVNVKGTHNVLKSALEHGVHKAVYLSSVAVFGQLEGRSTINEHTPLNGKYIGEYGKTKYLAYQEAMNIQEQGLAILVFMPGIIFGPGLPGTASLLKSFYRRRMKYFPESLNDNKIPLLFSRDLLQAIFAGIERNKFGEKYILVESSPTPKEFLRLLSEITGTEIKLKYVSYRKVLLGIWLREIIKQLTLKKTGPNEKRVRDTFKYMLQLRYRQEFDTSKARKELNWEPHPLKDALRETIAWFQENNAQSLSQRT